MNNILNKPKTCQTTCLGHHSSSPPNVHHHCPLFVITALCSCFGAFVWAWVAFEVTESSIVVIMSQLVPNKVDKSKILYENKKKTYPSAQNSSNDVFWACCCERCHSTRAVTVDLSSCHTG